MGDRGVLVPLSSYLLAFALWCFAGAFLILTVRLLLAAFRHKTVTWVVAGVSFAAFLAALVLAGAALALLGH